MAEFALIAPVLFLIILGIIEAGRFVLYYHTLNHAVREGARYAIVHGNNSTQPSGPGNTSAIVDKVEDAAFGLMGDGSLSVTVCYFKAGLACGVGEASNSRGDNVTVTTVYSYSSLLNLLPSMTLNAEATLVINN